MQAPTNYAEVGNTVEVVDDEEAKSKALESLRNVAAQCGVLYIYI